MQKPFEKITPDSDPFAIFTEWYGAAQKTVKEPTAFNLATVGRDGRPSSRIVLLKNFDPRGFVFYTNSQSKKGAAIAKNQNVALNFFWADLQKQIRIEGVTEKVEGAEADGYYNSRELGKRIGAWASLQSEILPKREDLFRRIQDFMEKFGDNPPRPPHWHGYRVKPDYFEFWQEGEFRLHERDVFERRKDGSWAHYKLYP